MNDQDLERQLSALRPAQPSPELMQRLRTARPGPAARVIAWPRRLARLALPLAAAAALALWLAPRTAPPRPAGFAAVSAQDYLLGAEAVGIGHDESGRPYRVLRGYGVRRAVWKNRADGSEIATVEPQQQLLLAKMDVF